jgi:hypothetical protein
MEVLGDDLANEVAHAPSRWQRLIELLALENKTAQRPGLLIGESGGNPDRVWRWFGPWLSHVMCPT